jgi:hypothetical protein
MIARWRKSRDTNEIVITVRKKVKDVKKYGNYSATLCFTVIPARFQRESTTLCGPKWMPDNGIRA